MLFKKAAFFIAASLLCSEAIQAKPVKIGIEAGVHMNNIRTDFDYYDDYKHKTRTGLMAGAILNVPFGKYLSLQPGLFYVQKGFRESYTVFYGNTPERSDVKWNVNYVQIPVNIQVYLVNKPVYRIFVGAGPYAAVGIAGKAKAYVTESMVFSPGKYTSDIRFGNGNADQFTRVDIGAGINIGILTRFGLFVRASGSMGFANLNPEHPAFKHKEHNIGGSLTAGFLLGK